MRAKSLASRQTGQELVARTTVTFRGSLEASP